ncbi:hypothetical protein B0J12DRAFT_423404 [Macrophomina phaseolina]|uniref:Transcription elongation factor Eaf N-terminal domain-containing protein n=1 Tax=Macrophomina phaseolina TaxID=35725 RepID=A0ABQ8GH63_9PEZI|nr:hypothetical protein B0J12DRAFT_423404 [Macrophomina phaseolina]
MGSSQPAEPSAPLNPHQNVHYTIKLSDRITNPSQGQSRFKTVKFNHKPKATANVRTTTIKPAATGDGHFDLCIRDKESANSTKASTYEYTGQRRELSKTYVLVFDEGSKTATLEPLDETYAFNLKSAPWEKDPAKLAEQYQQVRPRREKPDRQADAVNDDAGDLFSDGSDSGRSVVESMFGDGPSDDDEPDEGNPFDFRNFLKDAEQSEGFASPASHSGTPLRTTTTTTSTTTAAPPVARSTPLSQTDRSKAKQTLKPAPKPAVKQQSTATPASRKRKTPEPEQAAAKPKDKASTTTSASATAPATTKTTTKPQPTPAIRLDRRASTRPTDPALSSSAPASAPTATAPVSTQSSSRTSREPTPDDDDEDDDDAFGGLEIDWGGSDQSGGRGRGRGPRRSIALAFEHGVTGDGPVSLRSAADSASPNSRLHTPSLRATAKHAPDVIDFDVGGVSEEDEDEDEDGVHRQQQRAGGHQTVHHERGQEVDEEEEDDGQEVDEEGYAEDDEDADGDVDPLTLGSPATDTLHQQQQQHQHQQVELGGGDGEEEDDGGDDLEDDFEAEMAQALASAAEEDAVQHEESEESEEE